MTGAGQCFGSGDSRWFQQLHQSRHHPDRCSHQPGQFRWPVARPVRQRHRNKCPDPLLISIVPDGPADKAGLTVAKDTREVDGITYPVDGDIITAINDVPVRNIEDLNRPHGGAQQTRG